MKRVQQKNKIGRNDKCFCGSGKKYKHCCSDFFPPPNGTLQHMVDFDHKKDPFYARMMFQILNIRSSVFQHDEKQREKFDKLFDPILQNLVEARFVKEQCLELLKNHESEVADEKIARYDGKTLHVDKSIEMELNVYFKDFFIRGIMAMNRIIFLAEFFGHRISFVFAEQKKFERGKSKFLEKNNSANFIKLMEFIEGHRKNWYKPFNKVRIKIEHHGFKLPKIKYLVSRDGNIKPIFPLVDSRSIEDILSLLWNNLFSLCEEIIIFLLSLKVRPPFAIAEIPKDKRDPALPVKYVVTLGVEPPYRS